MRGQAIAECFGFPLKSVWKLGSFTVYFLYRTSTVLRRVCSRTGGLGSDLTAGHFSELDA